LAAKLFGGTHTGNTTFPNVIDYNTDPRTYGSWYSNFDTGERLDMFDLMAQKMRNPNDNTYIARLQGGTSFLVYSQYHPQMFVDSYLYIRGTPEASIFFPSGESTDLMAIAPRNRQTGANPVDPFLTGSTH
jgi:hypothetical protein